MNLKKTYPIPPTHEAFENWTEIDVPILTYTHDDVKRREEERSIKFNGRMRVLDFYVEDSTASSFQNSEGNPWHVVWVTERYSNGNPFHTYHAWYYPTREEAILVAQLANWFKYDEHALAAILAWGPLEKDRLSCEINGQYGRDYWINRLYSRMSAWHAR